ncbi:MAG: hypothetical protein ACRYFS_16895 [Janthinobacterium lividum]
MANDLVRWGRLDSDGYLDKHETDTQDDNEQWDTPPDQPHPMQKSFGSARRRKSGDAAQVADAEAVDARRRGDNEFAFTREGDAADLRQNPWDWGDLRTWAIIVGMCLGIFALTAFIYFMPQGRHGQNDGAEPVPHIRVY